MAARPPGGGALRHALREDARDFGADLVEVDAEAFEHAGGDAFAFADEAEQQVLGADVVVAQAAGLVDGQFDDLLGARRQADLAHDGAVAAADDELDGGADLVQLDAEVGEHFRGDAFALADEAEQEVLGADVVVVEAQGFFLGERQDAARSLRELIEPICHRSHQPSSSVLSYFIQRSGVSFRYIWFVFFNICYSFFTRCGRGMLRAGAWTPLQPRIRFRLLLRLSPSGSGSGCRFCRGSNLWPRFHPRH